MNRTKFLFTCIFVFYSSSSFALFLWPSKNECVQIYYDKSDDPKYKIGKVYATYLQNLLGHFPHYQQIVSPVEFYKKGDIEKCKASIYIGSYFQNKIPASFIEDYLSTKKNVAWLGYNIWQVDDTHLTRIFSHKYTHIAGLDKTQKDKDGYPGFFKFFKYKGETFEKFAKFVGKEKTFHAGFEMISLVPQEPLNSDLKIHSTGVHSISKKELPYILQNKNHFYVADVPFSYVHESDRYLIFSDILFDILEEEPRHKQKLAVIRIEDVSPLSPLPALYQLADVFKQENVPLNISLIPVFFDPLYRYERKPYEEFIPMNQKPDFLAYIEHIKKQGAEFIWHGVTHQYGRVLNPHSGGTGEDFEFWDAVNNKPIAEDSTDYVLDRLDYGWEFLKEANIEPVAWLTPHYQASALDYYIFARTFRWNVGRIIYFENTVEGINDLSERSSSIEYNFNGSKEERREFLKNLKVTTSGKWSGQLYPYEIYGDVYGQRLIPEILGNPQPFESAHVIYPRKPSEILADAKRNKVLRDSWASLFFHPYLLTDWRNDGIGEYPGDTRPLQKLLRGLKDLGYTFVDLKEFTKSTELRPEPIYRDQGD